MTGRKAEELLQRAERLDGQGYRTLVIFGWDYDFNFAADIESRLAQAKPPYRAQLHSRAIPPYIYDYLRQTRRDRDRGAPAEDPLLADAVRARASRTRWERSGRRDDRPLRRVRRAGSGRRGTRAGTRCREGRRARPYARPDMPS